MKKLILTILSFLLLASWSFADTYVNGYYRKDGTYVQGHYRSSQNNTKSDNYSTKGNYNPYTGKNGTVDPYSSSSSGSSYGSYGNSNKKKSGYR